MGMNFPVSFLPSTKEIHYFLFSPFTAFLH
jgi:hypothetical protein